MPDQSKEQEQKKTCPFCGESIASKAKKCRYCGEWLDVSYSPAKKETAVSTFAEHDLSSVSEIQSSPVASGGAPDEPVVASTPITTSYQQSSNADGVMRPDSLTDMGVASEPENAFSDKMVVVIFYVGLVGSFINAFTTLPMSFSDGVAIALSVAGPILFNVALCLFISQAVNKIKSQSLLSAPNGLYITTIVFLLLGILSGFYNPNSDDQGTEIIFPLCGLAFMGVAYLLLVIIGLINLFNNESRRLGGWLIIGVVVSIVIIVLSVVFSDEIENMHGRALRGLVFILMAGDYLVLRSFKRFILDTDDD